MKITLYELLKLMLERKAPKTIEFFNERMTFAETAEWGDYEGDKIKLSDFRIIDCLTEKVEIIEEPKKIEHCLKRDRFLCDNDEMEHFRTKIDELIDEVNRLKGEK